MSDELSHARTLATLAEESELLLEPLEWPEEILCNGRTETNLTPNGAGLIKGMLPLLRQRAMAANELAIGEIPGNHPDFFVAQEVREGLLLGLLILEALFSSEADKENGPRDSGCMHLARSRVQKASRRAQEHLENREKEITNV